MVSFAEFDDRTRANIFLKCFNGYFTDEEGRETAKQLNIMDYGDFIGLLQETRAIQKTSLGKYRINRHFLHTFRTLFVKSRYFFLDKKIWFHVIIS